MVYSGVSPIELKGNYSDLNLFLDYSGTGCYISDYLLKLFGTVGNPAEITLIIWDRIENAWDLQDINGTDVVNFEHPSNSPL